MSLITIMVNNNTGQHAATPRQSQRPSLVGQSLPPLPPPLPPPIGYRVGARQRWSCWSQQRFTVRPHTVNQAMPWGQLFITRTPAVVTGALPRGTMGWLGYAITRVAAAASPIAATTCRSQRCRNNTNVCQQQSHQPPTLSSAAASVANKCQQGYHNNNVAGITMAVTSLATNSLWALTVVNA